jgi:hypothetical protein
METGHLRNYIFLSKSHNLSFSSNDLLILVLKTNTGLALRQNLSKKKFANPDKNTTFAVTIQYLS